MSMQDKAIRQGYIYARQGYTTRLCLCKARLYDKAMSRQDKAMTQKKGSSFWELPFFLPIIDK